MQIIRLQLKDGRSLCGFIDTNATQITGYLAVKIKNDKEERNTTYIALDAIVYITIRDQDADDAVALLKRR